MMKPENHQLRYTMAVKTITEPTKWLDEAANAAEKAFAA